MANWRLMMVIAAAAASCWMVSCDDEGSTSASAAGCDEAEKPDVSCTCNASTGTWENCEPEHPKQCDESSKTDESCTCNTSTGAWENCNTEPLKDCDEASKTDESCTCNISTGSWENCEPEQPVEKADCSDPSNDGQTCEYEESIPDCAKAVCQELTCKLVPADAGLVCRQAAGDCDIQETCDGQALECPADAFLDASSVCRKAGGICDVEETCDGQSAACPEDKKQPTTFVCSKAVGKCDVDVTCDGNSNECSPKIVNSSCVCSKRAGTTGKNEKMIAIDHSGFVLRSRYWSKYEGYNNKLKSLLPSVSIDKLNFNRQMRKITKDLAESYKGKQSTYYDKNLKDYIKYRMTSFNTWIGYKNGWFWDESDVKDKNYTPQGMSVGEVNGFKFAIVVWHHSDDKRVKIHVMDINSKPPKYRHVLLVEPENDSFKDIANHAGGVAVVWPYLYETHGSIGLRVFDLRNILKVSTGDDCKNALGKVGNKYCAYNFAYVLPQVGGYYNSQKVDDDRNLNIDSSCKVGFSFISYDAGDGLHILGGEYKKETIKVDGKDKEAETYNGRLVRWPLGNDGKLKTVKATYSDGKSLGSDDENIVLADGAWYAGESAMQGAISTKNNGSLQFLITTTKDTKSGTGTARGGLRRNNTSKLGTILTANDGKWCYRPEGIAIYKEGKKDAELWISTEGIENPRAVFYSELNAVLKQ